MNSKTGKRLYKFILIFLLVGCSQTSTPDQNSTSVKGGSNTLASTTAEELVLHWLDYADAKAEANLAIQKRGFHLLAFTTAVTSFPGLEPSEVENIKARCGYRVLSSPDDSKNQRHKLYEFAATYNQLMWSACSKQLR